MEDVEDVDAESMQTQDATGIHHLQIALVVVSKVAYPSLEVAGVEVVLHRLHNKMRHVM